MHLPGDVDLDDRGRVQIGERAQSRRLVGDLTPLPLLMLSSDRHGQIGGHVGQQVGVLGGKVPARPIRR